MVKKLSVLHQLIIQWRTACDTTYPQICIYAPTLLSIFSRLNHSDKAVYVV